MTDPKCEREYNIRAAKQGFASKRHRALHICAREHFDTVAGFVREARKCEEEKWAKFFRNEANWHCRTAAALIDGAKIAGMDVDSRTERVLRHMQRLLDAAATNDEPKSQPEQTGDDE